VKGAEERFREEKLKVIWIGFQDKKEKIMEFMIKHDIDSSVGFDRRNLIATDYGIAYGAGLIAIDEHGVVIKRIPKGFSGEGLNEALGSVLNKEDRASVKK
jgi:predicted butyrate kinase (DUF1464 family)